MRLQPQTPEVLVTNHEHLFKFGSATGRTIKMHWVEYNFKGYVDIGAVGGHPLARRKERVDSLQIARTEAGNSQGGDSGGRGSSRKMEKALSSVFIAPLWLFWMNKATIVRRFLVWGKNEVLLGATSIQGLFLQESDFRWA
eukprot:TRINITY_DN9333_c0_g2_i1.p1 TRINITY_DN9333_c0_g2~~TRINITY_DN9333_c0_g2_i1.p1  ORF type:complete len:141 (+),score=8.86 TRINITY_DN9333_c0_g2_i1:119-541(+)